MSEGVSESTHFSRLTMPNAGQTTRIKGDNCHKADPFTL